jgi:two-component system chemotaxis response regulator CheY
LALENPTTFPFSRIFNFKIASDMKRILLIEADAPLSWLLQKILKTRYQVIIMNNSMEAWSWLSEANIPDLIIFDIADPSEEGLEVLESLQISGFLNDIPVIILSGPLDDSADRPGADSGAFSYITKPFDPQWLLSEIHRGVAYKREAAYID